MNWSEVVLQLSSIDIKFSLSIVDNIKRYSIIHYDYLIRNLFVLALKFSDFKEELSMAVNLVDDKPPNIATTVKTELHFFDINKRKESNLSFVYSSLLSVPGTSVESERAFSSAGYICNKFRSRLSDEMLDKICFLRSFFQTKNLKN